MKIFHLVGASLALGSATLFALHGLEPAAPPTDVTAAAVPAVETPAAPAVETPAAPAIEDPLTAALVAVAPAVTGHVDPAAGPVHPAATQAIGLREISDASRECIECHRKQSPGLYQQWGASKHYRGNIGCFECHTADKDDTDAFMHYDRRIAVIVSPKDCARCHSKEVEEFLGSHHAKAGRILGSLDNVLAEVVEGNRGLKTDAFPDGVSAAAVSGCWQCHGTEVKVLAGGKLDPATWPNTGIGRLHPDGSEGACSACHARHEFSAAQARHPNTCGKCHMGPDHPQKEIY